MSAIPRYVTRIARLPQVFARLAQEPDGMPLAELAAEFDVPVQEMREDLLAFYTADLSTFLLGLARPEVVEFLGADGDIEDPNAAEVVRIVAEQPADLGVEYVDAGELGLVYAAALALLDTQPDDAELGGAIDALAETMFGDSRAREAADPPGVPEWNHLLPTLQAAQRERRTLRIVYSRAWEQGVTEREIAPYRLVQTRRGWEVDAGPPDEQGRLRTYLLSNIRSASDAGGTFELPGGLADMLAAHRETTTVRIVLPQSARWVADFYAERVTNVSDDETDVEVDVELLPPLERRVGMILLAAGPDAFVVSPRELESAGVVLAEELLLHHGG